MCNLALIHTVITDPILYKGQKCDVNVSISLDFCTCAARLGYIIIYIFKISSSPSRSSICDYVQAEEEKSSQAINIGIRLLHTIHELKNRTHFFPTHLPALHIAFPTVPPKFAGKPMGSPDFCVILAPLFWPGFDGRPTDVLGFGFAFALSSLSPSTASLDGELSHSAVFLTLFTGPGKCMLYAFVTLAGGWALDLVRGDCGTGVESSSTLWSVHILALLSLF